MLIASNIPLFVVAARLFFVILLCSTWSKAETEALQLKYEAPKRCGSRQAVLQNVEAALGAEIETNEWAVLIKIERHASKNYSLLFIAKNREDRIERQLNLPSCQATVEASSLLLLLTLDPSLANVITVPESQSSPTTTPAGSSETQDSFEAPQSSPVQKTDNLIITPPSVSETGSRKAPSPVFAPDLWVSSFFILNTGTGISIGPGAKVELSAHGKYLGVALGGSWLANTKGAASNISGTFVHSHGYGAHLLSFARFGQGTLKYGPYFGADLQWLEAAVSGISDPTKGGSTSWMSVRLGARASLKLLKFIELIAELGAGLPLQRPIFEVEGLGVVHQTNQVVMEGSLGISWNFFSQ